MTPSHHPIPSLKVYLRAANKKDEISAQTDAKGGYRLSVPSGTYTLHAAAEPLSEPFPVAADRITVKDLTVEPAFFDEPAFTVAGVTDNTYRGGHGSDTVLRSSQAITKATALREDDRDHHVLAVGGAPGRGERPARASSWGCTCSTP